MSVHLLAHCDKRIEKAAQAARLFCDNVMCIYTSPLVTHLPASSHQSLSESTHCL